jgi:cardiolipin synthase
LVTTQPAISSQWLCGGGDIFPAMLNAIAQARQSVELEAYIFADDHTGRQFLLALVKAAQSGVRVRVLADAYGSLLLPDNYFTPLIRAGGEARFFNPLRFNRFGVRDHRKLLVCDRQTAFIGGTNISDDYRGDGVTHGWFDVMAQIRDADLAGRLAGEFERMFSDANFEHRPLPRIRAFRHLHRLADGEPKIFVVRPGRGAGAFQRALQRDLAAAASADFIVPYFLPNRRLRKRLGQIVRRGGRVRLILPAHCDVPLSRNASLVYYARLLRGGVEIYEYQPQVLHAKLYRVDGKVFAGSSNLDVRSFKLNYELMVRFTDPPTVADAKDIFSRVLKNSKRIELAEFRKSQNFWQRWKNYWANFLLAQIDPLVALRQLQPYGKKPNKAV